MKKIAFLLVPMMLLSALLFCFPAQAEEVLPEQEQPGQEQPEQEQPEQEQSGQEQPEQEQPEQEQPENTIAVIDLKEDNLDRFIELGQTPDFTNTEFIVTYNDGSFDTVLFDPSHLVSWDAEKKGRQPAVLNIEGVEHTEFFIVSDPSVDVLDFTDVTKSYWGYKQIKRAVQAGFFAGMSKTEFGVAGGMTRAQFCQMLYRIYKTDPSVSTDVREVQFADVPENMWYYEPVMACARAGIVAGVGDGTFLPEAYITRQDVAVIMMSVLEEKETLDTLDIEKVLEKARESGIAAGDFDSVSPYAQKYVASALGVIFYGDSAGNITPLSNITRTECAAMCTNLFFDNDTNEPPEKKLVYLSPESSPNAYSIYKKNDPSTHAYTEQKQMTIVAGKLKVLLEEMGYEVFIADLNTPIRDKNTFDGPPVEVDDIYCRAEEAYDMGADAYVALHTNASGKTNNGGAKGTMSFYNGTNPGSTELARAIHNKVAALTPTEEKAGAFQEDISYSATHGQTPYAEVWRPKMPNILLEVEYHDYAPYAWWIVNNTDSIAQAIADGIDEYFKSLE